MRAKGYMGSAHYTVHRQAGGTGHGGGCTAGNSWGAEVLDEEGGTTAGFRCWLLQMGGGGPSGCTDCWAGSTSLLGITGTSGTVPALHRLITERWPVVGR